MIAYYPSSIGLIRIERNEYGIRELKFVEEKLFPERVMVSSLDMQVDLNGKAGC